MTSRPELQGLAPEKLAEIARDKADAIARTVDCWLYRGGEDKVVAAFAAEFATLLAEVERLSGERDEARREVEQCHAKSTCMCGDYVKDHTQGSGHSPVSMYDHALDNVRAELRLAESSVSRLTERAETAERDLARAIDNACEAGIAFAEKLEAAEALLAASREQAGRDVGEVAEVADALAREAVQIAREASDLNQVFVSDEHFVYSHVTATRKIAAAITTVILSERAVAEKMRKALELGYDERVAGYAYQLCMDQLGSEIEEMIKAGEATVSLRHPVLEAALALEKAFPDDPIIAARAASAARAPEPAKEKTDAAR